MSRTNEGTCCTGSGSEMLRFHLRLCAARAVRRARLGFQGRLLLLLLRLRVAQAAEEVRLLGLDGRLLLLLLRLRVAQAAKEVGLVGLNGGGVGVIELVLSPCWQRCALSSSLPHSKIRATSQYCVTLAVAAGHPHNTFRATSRYCVTLAVASGHRPSNFRATSRYCVTLACASGHQHNKIRATSLSCVTLAVATGHPHNNVRVTSRYCVTWAVATGHRITNNNKVPLLLLKRLRVAQAAEEVRLVGLGDGGLKVDELVLRSGRQHCALACAGLCLPHAILLCPPGRRGPRPMGREGRRGG